MMMTAMMSINIFIIDVGGVLVSGMASLASGQPSNQNSKARSSAKSKKEGAHITSL